MTNKSIRSNITNKIAALVAMSLFLCTSAYAAPQVDENTSDATLLKGKDLSVMFEAPTPIARMTFTVEGVSSPVEVTYKDNTALLHVSALSDEERMKVKSAYRAFSGSDAVIVFNGTKDEPNHDQR
ncbi:hypothetical protein PN836_013815 [Ningiella sp. W23]|uniref:hypothetical protein n=1 Tax=Ningiella sp. W23 TaxID=3023715 RepID=UPI003757C4FA